MMGISHSRARLLESCPAAFKLAHIDRKPQAQPLALVTGKLSHKVFELCITEQMEQAEAAEPLLADQPPEVRADVLGVVKNFEGRQFMDQRGAEFRLSFDRDWKPTEWRAPDTAFRFIVDLYELDAERQVCTVTDFKTGWVKPDDAAIIQDAQLPGYVAALESAGLLPPGFRVIGCLDFVRINQRVTFDITPEMVTRARDRLGKAFDRLNKLQEFDPTPGVHCGTCLMSAHCPTLSELRASPTVLTVSSQAEALAAARQLGALRAAAKQTEEHLKQWTVAHGAIDAGGGRAFGPRILESTGPPADCSPLWERLRGQGFTDRQILNSLPVTKTSLNKLLKALMPGRGKWKVLSDALSEFMEQRTATRVEFHKAQPNHEGAAEPQ